jgi:protein-tyrosine phosphatase
MDVLPSPGASEILPGRLWMGGAEAYLELAGRMDLWIHCAGEVEPPPAAPRVIWVRLDDSRPIRPEEWRTACAAAREAALAVAAGRRVLVSCMAGVNRSGLVTGLTLRWLGIPGPQAIALVRRRRHPLVLLNDEYVGLILHGSCVT